jgi:hypothetical protein
MTDECVPSGGGWSVYGNGVGAVRFPLASAPTGSGRLEFVGSPVARQSLNSVLRRLPLYLCGATRRGPLPYMASAPDQDVNWIGFSIPEIFSKGREITFLTKTSTRTIKMIIVVICFRGSYVSYSEIKAFRFLVLFHMHQSASSPIRDFYICFEWTLHTIASEPENTESWRDRIEEFSCVRSIDKMHA